MIIYSLESSKTLILNGINRNIKIDPFLKRRQKYYIKEEKKLQ